MLDRNRPRGVSGPFRTAKRRGGHIGVAAQRLWCRWIRTSAV